MVLAVLLGAIVLVTGDGGPVGTAAAQLPDVGEAPGSEFGVFMIAQTDRAHAVIPEHGAASYELEIIDISIESAQAVVSPVPVRCAVINQTVVERGWSISVPTIGFIGRNEVKSATVSISPGASPLPQIFRAEISCTAGSPLNQEIGRFNLSARVEVFERFSLTPASSPPRVGPDENVNISVSVLNRGNAPTRFVGDVDAPEGWTFQAPPAIVVPPGESREVEIHGFSPRDKIWFRSTSEMVVVNYWPDGAPEKSQGQFVPVNLQGLYLHPALIPAILMGLVALAMLIMLIGYARRAVEEQVLGKPVPPWRIPVEREYLKRLEEEDQDEFYIVRYHLMVEEHHSALLWYKHFKNATRKDRKQERLWLKKTEKVKGKSERLRNKQTRLENRMARRLRVLPVRRRRRLAMLDKRNLDAQWREQLRLLKIHNKSVQRIDKIHASATKKEEKVIMAQFAKELKRAEKENKKKIREGEDPLPLPEEPVLERPSATFPEVVEVPLQSVEESRFALKAERVNRRYNKRIARRSKKAKRRMRKKGAKRDKRIGRLKSRLPPEPAGELYREDEFIPAEDVVVEDSRPLVHRALGIPDMETRDALKRRRMVYKVKIRQAKKADDPQRVERLKGEYAQERARLLSKEKTEDETETSDSGGGEGGGPMGRLVGRRRRASADSEAGDAANQVSKEEQPSSQGDGSSRGGRSEED